MLNCQHTICKGSIFLMNRGFLFNGCQGHPHPRQAQVQCTLNIRVGEPRASIIREDTHSSRHTAIGMASCFKDRCPLELNQRCLCLLTPFSVLQNAMLE